VLDVPSTGEGHTWTEVSVVLDTAGLDAAAPGVPGSPGGHVRDLHLTLAGAQRLDHVRLDPVPADHEPPGAGPRTTS